jgi:hypothetical protein
LYSRTIANLTAIQFFLLRLINQEVPCTFVNIVSATIAVLLEESIAYTFAKFVRKLIVQGNINTADNCVINLPRAIRCEEQDPTKIFQRPQPACWDNSISQKSFGAQFTPLTGNEGTMVQAVFSNGHKGIGLIDEQYGTPTLRKSKPTV